MNRTQKLEAAFNNKNFIEIQNVLRRFFFVLRGWNEPTCLEAFQKNTSQEMEYIQVVIAGSNVTFFGELILKAKSCSFQIIMEKNEKKDRFKA